MKSTATLPAVSPQQALEALGGLLEAAQAMAVQEAPETTLQLIADRARTLVDARYAALGIVGAKGRLERFITSGIDEADAGPHRRPAGGPRPARPDHPGGPLDHRRQDQ